MAVDVKKVMTPVRVLGLMLGMSGFVLSNSAFALVPGGSSIANTVTVNYQDSSGTTDYSEQAEVTITVISQHVLAWTNTSNLTGTNDSNVDPQDDIAAIGTAPSTYVYNVGNTSVLATVNLNTLVETNTTASSTLGNFQYDRASDNLNVANGNGTLVDLTLGLAIYTGVDGFNVTGITTDIAIFNDTHNLAVNDFVLINGTVYEVHGVNVSGPDTIRVRDLGSSASPVLAAFTINQFDIISEAIKIEPVGLFGTFANTTGTNGTFTTTTTADTDNVTFSLSASSTSVSPAATVPADLTYEGQVIGPALTISKFVRNIGGAACATNTYVSGANTYCDTVTDAEPGDQLEYLLVVSNAALTANEDADLVIRSISVADTVDDSFVDFDLAIEQGFVSQIAAASNCNITASPLWNVNNANTPGGILETWADDGPNGQVTAVGLAITAYYGSGANFNTGGSLAPTEEQCFSFTVTIQ